MKKNDIELIIDTLKDIKKVSDRLDYNSSSDINKRLMTILPIMQGELEQMEDRKIEITSVPKILVIQETEALNNDARLTDYTNKILAELAEQGNKIIDFGVSQNGTTFYTYIKYMVG